MYEDKSKAYIELDKNYKNLQKRFAKAEALDHKSQVVDLLNEVQKRGGVYNKMAYNCPNTMKKTVNADGGFDVKLVKAETAETAEKTT